MKSKVRMAAGIMAGFGIALAGVAALSLVGVVPLSIDFFGVSLDARTDRIAWIGAWSVVAVLGLAVLVVTRPVPKTSLGQRVQKNRR